jgi:adenosine deaminase
MPKAEVHLHLDGSLSPETIQELAAEQGYARFSHLSVKEIARMTVVDRPRPSLAEVLEAFQEVYPLLRTPKAVEKAAYWAVADAARDNVRYVEVRFAPVLQAREGFDPEQVLQSALRGLSRAKAETGVGSGVILCLLRPFSWVSLEKNREMLRLALKYRKRGVAGVDLAGDEAAQPLADYRGLFEAAKAGGLRMTAHAGESPGSRDIEAALDIGVDRLGHAVLLADTPGGLEKVLSRGVPIEVSLTSNLRTSIVPDLASHPVRAWYRAGVPIALSTDDPGVFGNSLSGEYLLLARGLGLKAEDVLAVSFESVDALFLPPKEKRRLRGRFEKETLDLLAGLAKGR